MKGRTGTTTVEALRKFAAPWFELPKDITGDGKVVIEGSAADSGGGTVVDATLNLDAVALTNEASTIVTDNLAAVARLRARLNDADTALEFDLTGKQGQVLVNPVLLDFGKNPLALESRANAERRPAGDRIAAAHTEGSHRAHGHGQREPRGRDVRVSAATSSSRNSSSPPRTPATCRSRWPPPACSATSRRAVV